MNDQATTTSRRGWGVIAVALVLAFLGHDAIMASSMHAAPSTPSGAHEHTGHPARGGVPLAAPPNQTTPDRPVDHPTDCAVVRFVAPRSDGQGSPTTVRLPGTDAEASPTPPVADASERWADPTVPSWIRRALLQVYRI